MADIQIHFLDPMIEFYGSAKGFPPGLAKRLEAYSTNLNEEALRAAAEKLTANHSRPPNLQALQKALRSAEASATIPLDTSVRPYDTKTIERLAWEAEQAAIQHIRQHGRALAMTADREGWLKRLLEFVQDHGRMPDTREIDKCRRQSIAVLNEVNREDNGPLLSGIQVWHANMLDSTGRKVLGEDAIVRGLEKKTVRGAQGYRAGTDAKVRAEALATLEHIANEQSRLSLSPMALKAVGVTPRKPPEPDEENSWHTEEPS